MSELILYLTRHPSGMRVQRRAEEIVAEGLGYYRLIGDLTRDYTWEWVETPPASVADLENDDLAHRCGVETGRKPLGQRSTIIITPPSVRERDPNKIAWEAPIEILHDGTSSADGTIVYHTDGSITVKNRNPYDPNPSGGRALKISTNRLVNIENVNARCYGSWNSGRACISSNWGGNRMRIRNTIGFSGNPGVDGGFAAKFVSAEGFAELLVEHSEAYHTTGIVATNWTGSALNPQDTLTLLYNRIRNLDSRVSAGPRVYRRGNVARTDYVNANLVQMDGVRGIANVLIAYNECVNDAGESRFEDMLSGYLARGTASSFIRYYRNFLRGGYPYDDYWQPGMDSYGNNMPAGTPGMTGDSFRTSGTMGMLTDGDSGATAETDAAYVLAEENWVFDGQNAGIAASGGHDVWILNNRFYKSGYVHNLPGNVRLSYSRTLPVQLTSYSTPYTQDRWYGHRIEGNVGTWARRNADGTVDPGAFWVDTTAVPPVQADKSAQYGGTRDYQSYTFLNNTNLPAMSKEEVEAKAQEWYAMVAAQGITLGAS